MKLTWSRAVVEDGFGDGFVEHLFVRPEKLACNPLNERLKGEFFGGRSIAIAQPMV
jgi:hypothetical protein